MYRNNRQRRYNGQKRQGGNHRIKAFNPSQIVNNNQIKTQSEELCDIKHKFEDFLIEDKLKKNILERGFSAPTPIQDQTIPVILEGRDVTGLANTGTGKTAAFLIPLINKTLGNRNQKVLIIAPTRELAVQIETEMKSFSKNLGIFSVVCIGGVSINNQIRALNRDPQFVIGTPGRLLDLNEKRKINFRYYQTIVLDEVDQMLDMGFIHDIQKIISQLPQERHSLFFSATIGPKEMGIVRQFTSNPVTISVKAQDFVAEVEQKIINISGRNKVDVLRDLLDQRELQKVLVFGRTKRGADKLARNLSGMGFRVAAIHGNKSQNQRQRSLESFRRGDVSVLIATDVMARGIDVDDITHVINYELPESYEYYLHRIGRTGRAGKKGIAFTFVD